jgi:hypothetical protein
MTQLDKEATWWFEQATKANTDAWLIAFGIYAGLTIAKQIMSKEASS